MSKKNKLSRFSKFLIIYASVISVAVAIVLFLLYGLLKDYEEGRPSVTMDRIAAQFTAENVEQLLDSSGVAFNAFENNERVAAYLKEKLGSEQVSYKKKSGEYSENTPVYVVYAGETAVAKVRLAENGKNSHKFTKWKLGEISFDGIGDKKKQDTYTIQAPKGSVVLINGVTAGAEYITEDDVAFDPCKNVSGFVTPPVRTVYTVSGLIAEPEVTVLYHEQPLTVEVKDGAYLAEYPEDEAMLLAQQDQIMTVARNYGKYIINRGSLSALTQNMVGSAKEYVSDIPAVWAFLYGKTYTYEFRDESISNFRKYAEDCFSCDIYYDLYVDWGNGNKTYNTSLTYTFVNTGGKWYVADFTIN